MLKITWGKTVGAAVLLFVTTADDALWLIPFVAPGSGRRRYTPYQRLQHMLVFVLTIQMVVWVSVAISFGLKASMSKRIDEDLPLLGALLCWMLTFFLVLRGIYKRRLKAGKKGKADASKEDDVKALPKEGPEKQQEEENENPERGNKLGGNEEVDEESSLIGSSGSAPTRSPPSKAFKYLDQERSKLQADDKKEESIQIPAADGSITAPLLQTEKEERGEKEEKHKSVTAETEKPRQQLIDGDDEDAAPNCDNEEDFEVIDEEDDVQDAGWGTVFSLAFLGALDELAYFPTLLIGGSFSALELSVGALVACLVILLVITTVLSKIRPLLDCMDQIPLWAFTTVFAIFLTIDAFA